MRNTVLIGSALQQLKLVPSEHAHCVVTSPPYFALRDYGEPSATWGDGSQIQLGLESTPEAYLDHLTEIFSEVHRVLRSDGSLWLNLGDTYANKELLQMPSRFVSRLREIGFILRSEICWDKGSGMPENVHDRPTRSFEPLFLLTKGRKYYYDSEAVREESGANLRSVWRLPTERYGEAHPAVFPPALPRRCIRLSTSQEGACEACGAPLERILERVSPPSPKREGHPGSYAAVGTGSSKGYSMPSIAPPEYLTKGWQRTCKCPEGPIESCLVLDPFAGSGTTLMEAQGLRRDYLGIEINPESAAEIQKRLETTEAQGVLEQARLAGIDMCF